MAVSTFAGMTLGHQSLWFVLMAGLWSAVYALLAAVKGGTSWAALQWTVWLLVSGAFHTTRGERWGGRPVPDGCNGSVAAVFAEEDGAGNEARLPQSLGNLRRFMRMQTPVCLFSLRLTVVVTAAAEFYRYTSPLNGYWAPMTALLVVRANPLQTLTRGVMRVAGTLLGAGVASLIAAHRQPSPVALAALIVFFA